MKSRKIEISDYEQLKEWWSKWGWAVAPTLEFLSTDGVIISDDTEDICAGFIYTISNAPIAWLTFPISNPNVRGQRRKDAIKLMIDTLTEKARELGYKFLYSSLRNSSMIEAQKNCGFLEAGHNHTELIKII